MDVVIRAPRLAPLPTKLRGAQQLAEDTASAADEATPRRAHSDRAALREAVHAELLEELSRQTQSDRVREAERGFQEGLQRGRAAADEDLRQLSERVRVDAQQALAALRQAHQDAMAGIERLVGDIAFIAACHVIGDAAVSKEAVTAITEHAVSLLTVDTQATVRLHPRDRATLEQALGAQPTIRAIRLHLVDDVSIQSGGCIVEAASGHYDASLSTQLARLHTVLKTPTTA